MAGLSHIIKSKRIKKFLNKEKATIVCLQETHLRPNEEGWLKMLFKEAVYHTLAGSRVRRLV